MGKEMTVCPDCGKEVKLQGLAAHKRIVHGEGIQISTGNKEALPEETPSITAPKTLTLSGEDLGIADMLIRSGFAKDLNELTHKSLNLTHSNLNRLGGGYKMENPTREETFEDVDRMRDRNIVRKYKEQQIKAMEEELVDKKQEKPEIDDEEKIIRQMERQIRIKTMKKALDEGEFSLGKMMEMRMMDKMFGETSGKSSEVQALQNQLNLLQQQMQQERLIASQQLQNERVMQKIEQMSSVQPGLTAQDVLAFTVDKDKAIKEVGLQLQEARDRAMTEKLVNLQQQIQQTTAGGGLTSQRIQAFNEELKAVKAMAGEFGDRPKGAGEYISETISNVATQLQPALSKFIEQKAHQPEFPPSYPYPEPQPGQFSEQMSEQMQEPPIQEPVSSLTPSEREMSENMARMYLKK